MSMVIKKSSKQVTVIKNQLNETLFEFTVGPYPFKDNNKENDGQTYYMIESTMLNICEVSTDKQEIIKYAQDALQYLVDALNGI